MKRRIESTALLAAMLSVIGPAAPVGAQDEPLALSRLTGEVTIDGRPDEAAWQAVPPLPLTMFLPVAGGTPTQRTEIRVAYDDDHFYAAGWFYDDAPNDIRVNSLYRDRWNGDDAFAIYLDVFNDNRNAKWFGTTPSGMRFEQLVSDDGATLNGSWDTFWDARATITDQGWFTEVRIPFSSLGFQVEDGRAVMGLTVTRLVSRLNERVTFPAIPPGREFRQPSIAHDVVLTGVQSAKPLYVTPYALSGTERATTLQRDEASLDVRRDEPREVGLDLRYPLSSELTLDVTLNTDFAQVEADDQQVNLDRFTLFFPEKRRFFQERSELFDFVMGTAGGRLFHSRQIGLLGGVPVPVFGGARLVGRAGDWDVGVLDMQTEAIAGTPSENFGVARVRRGVLNPYSYVGGMVTSRASELDRNLAYGLDTTLRLFGDDYLTARWAQTFDEDDTDDVAFLDRSQYYLIWQRRVNRGLMYEFATSRSGPDYTPALGFLPRRDFTTANVHSNYFFWTDEHPVLRRIWPGMIALSTFRNADGALETGTYAVWVQWETKTGGGGWLEPKLFRENVAAPFTIGGEADSVVVPAGDYTFADFQVYLSMGSGRRVRTSIDARAGTYFGGTRAQVILSPTWNVSRHFELGTDYQLTRLRFDERDEGVDIHLARLRLRGALNARASGNAFIQYNSTSDRLGLSFRLRYNFAEGTDLWLVYDEALATERLENSFGVREPFSTARALVLKYSHTFAF
jgi:Domain of unknown function (DUF5916)/Carbohydrate family 9 binding domain-like